MIVHFIEVTDLFNYGRFAVMKFDKEWSIPAQVVNEHRRESLKIDWPTMLLLQCGWNHDDIIVFDLVTCEGAAFKPSGVSFMDLEKHRIWVCPMFGPFLSWLYEQDLTDITKLPPVVKLEGPKQLYGYRRPGVESPPIPPRKEGRRHGTHHTKSSTRSGSPGRRNDGRGAGASQPQPRRSGRKL